MPVPVLLDACVLLPYQLCDLLLRLGEADLYRPLWSADILDEVERNLVGSFDKTPRQAHRRVQQMQAAFPHAAVEDYADLTPVMTTHPKDRHVAAAAVRGGAAVIVTANLKDFPPRALDRYDIDAVHPDRFLQDQLDLDPQRTLTCLREQRTAYTRPQLTTTDFYRTLRVTVAEFAQRAEASTTARLLRPHQYCRWRSSTTKQPTRRPLPTVTLTGPPHAGRLSSGGLPSSGSPSSGQP